MHSFEPATGGVIPSPTVTGRGDSGGLQRGGPVSRSEVVLPPPLSVRVGRHNMGSPVIMRISPIITPSRQIARAVSVPGLARLQRHAIVWKRLL
jgi:hypothetical protein